MSTISTFDFNTLLQQAKTASYDALPDNDYDAECIEATATTASTGKPMLKCKFRVTTGPHAKRQFFNQFVLSLDNPQALAMFFRHMKAFGLDENYFTTLGGGSLAPVAQVLVGRQARFTLGHREWQGENRNDVKAVKPIPGNMVQPAGGLPTSSALPGVPATPVPSGIQGGLPTSAPNGTTANATATSPPNISIPVANVTAPVATQPTAPTQPTQPTQPTIPTQPAAQPTPTPPATAPNSMEDAMAAFARREAELAAREAALNAQTAAQAQSVTAEPQPVPPVEQPLAAAPAVTPPPPMPF